MKFKIDDKIIPKSVSGKAQMEKYKATHFVVVQVDSDGVLADIPGTPLRFRFNNENIELLQIEEPKVCRFSSIGFFTTMKVDGQTVPLQHLKLIEYFKKHYGDLGYSVEEMF